MQSESAARELAERMEHPRREVRKALHGNANDARAEQEAVRDKRIPRHF